jgi:hypothetical protein
MMLERWIGTTFLERASDVTGQAPSFATFVAMFVLAAEYRQAYGVAAVVVDA